MIKTGRSGLSRLKLDDTNVDYVGAGDRDRTGDIQLGKTAAN
jgi:hypothetical protein